MIIGSACARWKSFSCRPSNANSAGRTRLIWREREMQFRTVIMTGSWRCGSTALNLSLIQHPGIFGWIEETNFLKVVRAPDGWKEGQWIIQKNPQYARVIAKVVQECPPNRVILLARNPYAICR